MSLTYGFCLGDLSGMYDSARFSDAFRSVTGDGITPYGSKFSVTINGFTVTLGSGYSLAAGRWLSNDDSMQLSVPPSGNNDDRTDALIIQVDHKDRKASVELIVDVDRRKLPDALRNDDRYSILLYLIQIPRGASTLTPGNVTDLRADPVFCGTVPPLSAVSVDVLYIYDFLTSGIDREVARIIELSRTAVDKGDAAIAKIDTAIQRAEAGPSIGELRTACRDPGPGWLICDGSAIPDRYTELSGLLGEDLPDIPTDDGRYRTYIYAGDEA